MKHFLSYDVDGKLVGMHTHHHAGTKLGGWPDDCRLDHPACPNPTSKWFRENVVGKNGIVGFIAYTCGCSPTATNCSCVSHAFATKKVVDGVLVSKLEGALLEGGSIIPSGTTIRRPPGTKIQLKVACVGVADGARISVNQRGQVQVLESTPIDLVFTNGETPTFEVTAPAQGLTGGIGIFSRDVLSIGVFVLGWA